MKASELSRDMHVRYRIERVGTYGVTDDVVARVLSVWTTKSEIEYNHPTGKQVREKVSNRDLHPIEP